MKKISLIINCDTRLENDRANEMFKGVVSRDFLTDGLFNKINFFSGFDLEIIMHIDEHEPVKEETLQYIRSLADVVIIRKHTSEHSFNDWNYIRALQMATGDYVCHVDQDTAMFSSSQEAVQSLINLLSDFKYLSYPSNCSPNAVHDESFNYRWASTRFFICRRETLNFPEIIKCLTDYEYFCEAYKPSRVCPWLEHFLGLIAKSSVYYPPIELDKCAIFSWGSYQKGLLRQLNDSTYEDVKKFVYEKTIQYPNDIYA